jgi:hypothetical protein
MDLPESQTGELNQYAMECRSISVWMLVAQYIIVGQ